MDILWLCIAIVIVTCFVLIVSIFIIRLIYHWRKYGKFPEIIFETNGKIHNNMDEIIDKWLKNRNNKELSNLYSFIKDKELINKLGLFSFRWTVNGCEELLDLKLSVGAMNVPFDEEKYKESRENIINAQYDCIDKYKKSKICVRCKNELLGVILTDTNKKEFSLYPIEYLFLTIYQYSGLCANCIGDFFIDFINKHSENN